MTIESVAELNYLYFFFAFRNGKQPNTEYNKKQVQPTVHPVSILPEDLDRLERSSNTLIQYQIVIESAWWLDDNYKPPFS